MAAHRKILICEDDLKQLLVEFLNKQSEHVVEVYEQELDTADMTPVRKVPESDKNRFRRTGSCVECQHRRVVGKEIHCSKKTFDSGAWSTFMDNYTCDLFERRDWRTNNAARRAR